MKKALENGDLVVINNEMGTVTPIEEFIQSVEGAYDALETYLNSIGCQIGDVHIEPEETP